LTKTTSSNNNSKKDYNNNNSYRHEGKTRRKESVATYRILLVDDDHDILFTFKEGLEENDDAVVDKSQLFGGAKIQVDTFADPKEALSSFKAGVYDLLLLDIRMQDMNGFELCEELKKIDDKPKVCFITAYELYYEALKKDFPKLDVGCFIKKPISIEDLAIKISEELA
jgi:two-component system catabolic regulation response regulator CreB/two-component system response regulator ChvI